MALTALKTNLSRAADAFLYLEVFLCANVGFSLHFYANVKRSADTLEIGNEQVFSDSKCNPREKASSHVMSFSYQSF